MAAVVRSPASLLCLLLALVSGSSLFCAPVFAEKNDHAFGDRELLSSFPSNPGFPEGVAVYKDKAYVCGAATSSGSGTAGRNPSTITITDLKTGAVDSVFVSGEDTTQEHQLSCCIVSKTRGQSGEGGDGDGHRSLYAVSPQLGILRFDLSTRQQSVYAPPPAGGWNVANDLAFDKKDRLIVSESNPPAGGKLWMIPPGGGTPTVWLQGPPLAATFPNGLAVSPDGTKLFLVVSTTDSMGFGNGIVYSLPITDQPPDISSLQVVHAYTAGEVPDGIRFGASGNLYVALALVPQAAPSPDFLGGVDILTQDGVQINRLLTSNGQGPNYFNPANMAFDDKRRAIVVTNHGFTCDLNAIDSCNFNAIRVYVDDKGAKEY